MTGHFTESSEEEYVYQDPKSSNQLTGTLKKIIICSKTSQVDSIVRSDNSYGRFILRFYENKYNEFIRMSLCDYTTGILSEDLEESMSILSEKL